MHRNTKPVDGVGINDSDYVTQKYETLGYDGDGKRIRRQTWACPFYRCWRNVIKRCYNDSYKKLKPTYLSCKSVPEWHYFMTFKVWMETQDWEGKHIDKDLLFPGNKIYGPETCIFIDQKINSFLTESTATRGDHPIGVYLDKRTGKFKAQCYDVMTGKRKFLGYFLHAEDAHQAWLTHKLEKAKILAAEQTDPRIAKALIERYKNYAN